MALSEIPVIGHASVLVSLAKTIELFTRVLSGITISIIPDRKPKYLTPGNPSYGHHCIANPNSWKSRDNDYEWIDLRYNYCLQAVIVNTLV